MTFETIDAFGRLPVPGGVDVVVLQAGVGRLTALHAAPQGTARGVVLLVPGFTGSKEDFLPFLPLLAECGWDAWTYSQRGQADSVAPEGVDRYRSEDFAADAVEVAGMVGDGSPVHLLGHSFGGVVAQEAAIASPDAFASLTVFCSGPRGWPGRTDLAIEILRSDGSIGLWNRENSERIGAPDDELEPRLAFKRLRAGHTSTDSLLAAADILQAHPDRTTELLATGLPIHVAHGEADDAWPIEWQREMAERLGARYSVIPGGAHSPQLEAPEQTAAALDDFWRSVGG